MAHEMIDRITKAIGEHFYGFCEPAATPHTWASARGAAEEVVKAMREPTSDMVISATEPGGYSTVGAKGNWHDMIDAILKENPSVPE